MHGSRFLAFDLAILLILTIISIAGAQPGTPVEPNPPPSAPAPGSPTPPGPTQPSPVPSSPATPGIPTPAPTDQEQPQPPLAPETAVEPPPIPEDLLPTRGPTLLGPSIFVGPDLFNMPSQQGWLSIVPTFTLSGEYDDNVGQRSSDRESDFGIGFTPGLTASMQRRGFTLLAGYNVSGHISVKDASLNDFGKHQQFFADLRYQISPTVAFTVRDRFIRDENSNAVTTSSQSVGAEDALRNTLTPRLRWQATPSTGLGFTGTYSLLRFSNAGGQSRGRQDSDTYRLGVEADHKFTGRLTGLLDAGAAYFDFERESPARSYTLRPGITYDLTPTLGVRLSAGPSLVDRRGEQEVRPAVLATLSQAFKFGALLVGYDRAVTAEPLGIADTQSFFAALIVPTLIRGLQFSFTPRYSILDSDVVLTTGEQNQRTTTLTLNLRAIYNLGRNFSLVGSYTFFHQTDDRGTGDIDQNRVFFGIQYAFPINFY